MNKDDLKRRTKAFALRVLKVADALPKSVSGKTMANQIARSGTSVAANYRAACRAKSTPDFISKMGTVEEEADKTLFWLAVIADAGLLPVKNCGPHGHNERNQRSRRLYRMARRACCRPDG